MKTKKVNKSQLKEVILNLIKEEYGKIKEANYVVNKDELDQMKDKFDDNDTVKVINEFEGTEDEYLESNEYFVKTYFNGNFKQLESMFKTFKEKDKMSDLLSYLNNGEYWGIKDWIIKNC